jgi:hypothetical protein
MSACLHLCEGASRAHPSTETIREARHRPRIAADSSLALALRLSHPPVGDRRAASLSPLSSRWWSERQPQPQPHRHFTDWIAAGALEALLVPPGSAPEQARDLGGGERPALAVEEL